MAETTSSHRGSNRRGRSRPRWRRTCGGQQGLDGEHARRVLERGPTTLRPCPSAFEVRRINRHARARSTALLGSGVRMDDQPAAS